MNTKKLPIVIAVIITLLCFFTACQLTERNREGKMLNISNYTIIRPEYWYDDKQIVAGSVFFRNTLIEMVGNAFDIATDWIKRGETLDESGYEILIGDTNRTASNEALAYLEDKGENVCLIQATENKLVIVGKTNNNTIRALKYFLDNIASKSDRNGSIPFEVGRTEEIEFDSTRVIYPETFTELEIECQTTVYASTLIYPNEQCTYGKIIKLEHNDENNGILLGTREVEGSTSDHYPIYRSEDNGETWKRISKVFDNFNSNSIAGYQPYLFELPADIGEFKEGTVILAGCSRKGNTNTIITLYYSTNQGKTWKGFTTVDMAGQGKNGIWEPCLMYEESTGRIYCFYSDESDSEYSQKLVYKYSTDLVNWTGDSNKPVNKVGNVSYIEPFECLRYDADTTARPGMISMTKMGNGEYFMVYEAYGIGNNVINYKKTSRLDEWDIPDGGIEIKSKAGRTLGSAPTVVWTPDGGECGTLIVVAQFTNFYGYTNMNGGDRKPTDMFISHDYGETFVSVDNPVYQEFRANNRVGYSAGFYVDNEGTVYYMQNTHSAKYGENLIFTRMKFYR